MMEPPRSAYDLHFAVFGIPVRVHPMFWLMTILLGMNAGEPMLLMMWVGVVFVSILVHELGHAIAALAQGWRPWITLYSMGGLASYQPSFYRPWTQIMISFAGPLAGFVLAAIVVVLVVVSGHSSDFLGYTFGAGPELVARNEMIAWLVFQALQVNIFWGLINLLPVLPLDGGQITRELLTLYSRGAVNRQALIVSMYTAGGVAIAAILKNEVFIGLFFGFLAYNSFQSLQSGGGSGFGGYGGGRWR